MLTLTQSESFVLTPETSPNVTVGNGMIGLANTSISLSDVPLFSATTANGSIYLEPGAGVNSTAVNVNAGGMYGMANNVSVTSQANFLTIEKITATGTAQAAMNHGSLLEYPSAELHRTCGQFRTHAKRFGHGKRLLSDRRQLVRRWLRTWRSDNPYQLSGRPVYHQLRCCEHWQRHTRHSRVVFVSR